MPKLKKINGVEIFSAGVWNGDEYSTKDLDEMVRAFEENGTQRPPLKLGHDDKQAILQRDGMPAAGWVGSLYRQGEKLLADFVDIPGKVYDLLKLGAYKKVSAEIYWNAKLGQSMYRRILGAVALLGADTPGVTNLKDIFDMYSLTDGDLKVYDSQAKSFIIEIEKTDLETTGDLTMEEKQKLEKLESDLTAEKQKNHESTEKVIKLEQEVAELKKFASDAQADKKAAEEKAQSAQLESTLTELSSERLITPAMKPYVRLLLGEEKKEYSLKPEGGEEKKFSKSELLKEVLKLHKHADVNTDEDSEAGEVEGEASDSKALDSKIQKYSKEHNVSYKVAYKAVMSEQGETDEDSDEASA